MRIIFVALALALPSAHAAQPIFVGPPSILPQCLDREAKAFVGPSARARECTRQYCATPTYQAKVSTYAMNREQNETDQMEALTCITRWEHDKRGN
jgi:hypothetical protein